MFSAGWVIYSVGQFMTDKDYCGSFENGDSLVITYSCRHHDERRCCDNVYNF